jgi:DNA-binding transcriptional LysR family regulator
VDLDLAQIRAFVAAAEQRHFGRAANTLFLSQQALSKRIGRLEQAVGQRLLARQPAVELTEAGLRFLPHARRLLADAEAATASISTQTRKLKVDLWGTIHPPLQIVRRLTGEDAGLIFELSMRRSVLASIAALRSGELDVGFGRVRDLGRPWPEEVVHEPVLLERATAVVPVVHPLAGASVLRAEDLRTTQLWWPLSNSPPEMVGVFHSIVNFFDVPFDDRGANLGIDHFITQLTEMPDRISLIGTGSRLPADPGLRLIPLYPTPCWAWSLISRRDEAHPHFIQLRDYCRQTGRAEGWLEHDPEHDWIPEADRTDLLI